MTDKRDDEADERDSQPDDERDSQPDDERDSDAPSEPEPASKKKGPAQGAVKATPAADGSSMPSSRAGLFVILALAAGGAAGWFGQIQQAKAAAVRADQAAPVGSNAAETGVCGAWQTKICGSTGKESAACQQAKEAAELLTPSACTAALDAMPATLTRIKAARASCDKLVGKLCTDLPPGSSTCSMVKERTPSFPAQRCSEMLKHYDEVLEQLKMLDQQGGPRMGGPGGPGAPGGPGGPGGPGSPGPIVGPH